MDPISHTMLGAVAAYAGFGRTLGRPALLIGGLAGLAADVDVFFGPFSDPAVPFELHRHFTHAIAFAPIGAALTALPFLLKASWRKKWPAVLGATTIGFGLHGLLDACTSYGTVWLWPFSSQRVAFDIMSIIDPVFTVPLIAAALLVLFVRRPAIALATVVFCAMYVGGGLVQKHRALDAQQRIATSRGHAIEHRRVMPTLGNLLIWRSVYVTDGVMHADALRVAPGGAVRWRAGSSMPLVREHDLPADLLVDALQRRRLNVFASFADGYIGHPPREPQVLADMRYSIMTEHFVPMWGMEMFVAAVNPHPQWDMRWVGLNRGQRRNAVAGLWRDMRDPSRFDVLP
jgi:inner membrane protein